MNKRMQTGVSMIEVLVSMLVLGVAVMGYAGLEVTGLKTTNEAFVREQATALVVELKERIRMNRGAQEVYFEQENWNKAIDLRSDCGEGEANCQATENERALADVNQIKVQVDEYLSEGDITVKPCSEGDDGGPQRCITVSWDGLAAADCDLSTGVADADALANRANCVELAVYDYRNF